MNFVDVDECQDPGLNPCSGHCINIEGGVRCGCPSGMIGDGRKEGSGCSKKSKKASPLNVILGIQFSFFSSKILFFFS